MRQTVNYIEWLWVSFMRRQKKIIIEEVFSSKDMGDRKKKFNEIFIRIIKNSEALKNA